MSAHRRVCTSQAPSIAPAPDGHTHACVHDAEPWLDGEPLEHQCECGTTWTAFAIRESPPDTSWITMEEQRGLGIWPLVAAVAIVALVAAAIIWTAGL